ncbi:uncharacterized protein LOC119163789 isoform X3 [Rhipicephalus microplus]|uniref:uncharacterized protein LOC119163789 isoform X3 n=1 Tax=Rhipicephalus microplus TaxID=6941 RepID=UPI003F6D4B46
MCAPTQGSDLFPVITAEIAGLGSHLGVNGETVPPGSFLGLLDRPELIVLARTEHRSPPTRPKVFIGGRDLRTSD